MKPEVWSFQSDLVIFEGKFLLIGTRQAEIFRTILSYISQQLGKYLPNSEMDHVQACITWRFRYNNFICFRIQQSESMTFVPGSNYPHFEKWKLLLVQYSLKYASSNANWCKALRVFLVCALLFAPIWNNLIKNYLYTVQVTIWSKERVLEIWLIRFLVKDLYDFFLAWTHFICSERIYIHWS